TTLLGAWTWLAEDRVVTVPPTLKLPGTRERPIRPVLNLHPLHDAPPISLVGAEGPRRIGRHRSIKTRLHGTRNGIAEDRVVTVDPTRELPGTRARSVRPIHNLHRDAERATPTLVGTEGQRRIERHRSIKT